MPSSHHITILIVEDEPAIASVLEHTLAELGYAVLPPASSAAEALLAIEHVTPDLALVDIDIEGDMDGIVLADILRAQRGIPVVFLTSFADDETLARAKSSEPYGYLLKPAEPDELHSTIGIALNRRDAERRVHAREQCLAAELARQLEYADRLASIGAMASGIAHDINNPLAVVITNMDYATRLLENGRQEALRTLGPEAAERGLAFLGPLEEVLHNVKTASDRIRATVADLRSFARVPPEKAGPTDLRKVVFAAIHTTAHELRHRAQVVPALEAVPAIDAPEARLLHVFVNLLINAAQAITPGNVLGNEVRIVARRGDNDRVLVEVRDTGEGIDPDVLPHVFQPFMTTKPFGTGTGLGLAVCRGILKSLGGTITVESDLGVGTVFRLDLPAASTAAIELVPTAAPPRRANGGRRAHILLIDDEPMMRLAMRRTLDSEHDVVAPDSALAAFDLLEGGSRFDVILCDLMMPDMTGMDLYEQMMRIDPEQGRRMIFLSGGAYTNKAVEFLRSVPNRQVEKPFEPRKLRDLIGEVVEAWGPPPTSTPL